MKTSFSMYRNVIITCAPCRPLVLYCLVSLWLLSALLCCSNDKEQSVSYIDYVPNNPVVAYLDQANNALGEWGIGLRTGVLGTTRNIDPGYQANPPNWITVASETDCSALGVPLELRKSGAECELSGNVVGVCHFRSYKEGPNAGEIIDSTVILEREALAHFSTEMKMGGEGRIKALLSHEIGHCLGLQHWGNTSVEDSDVEPGTGTDKQPKSHIMYPSLTMETTMPKNLEIAAIKGVYQSAGGCSSSRLEQDCVSPNTLSGANNCGSSTTETSHSGYENLQACYYTPVSSQGSTPLRYHQARFPTFHISASVGNAGMRAEARPPGPPIQGEISTYVYKMRMDGREKIWRIDPKGRKEVRTLIR